MKNEYTRQDALEMLGLRPGVDEKAVREAYRRLAKQYHPDCALNGGESCEKFREVQKAYETLCGPPEKDEELEVHVKQPHSSARQRRRPRTAPRAEERWPFFSTSWSESFFEPPADLEIELSPREARFGTTVNLELPVESACPRCHGFGLVRARTCRSCGGSGRVILSRQFTVTLPPQLSDGDLVQIYLHEVGPMDRTLYALLRVR
ncbi:MAG: J domain-containing protein [Candidatus Abyssobacteria bacterium SURF_17]|uniref:J domain-containing protein n=1 Tax=Candidatus Abyssobacteria bacterium SURF_17 TaxID=2093361 RepID=A0A419F8J6_9BACT|nr:MAG: J domain-containing protein [Candidatus Abyssubacteria bacterium SURF_17]